MRRWMMGNHDSWIMGRPKYGTLRDAIGGSPPGSNTLFLYEDNKLIAVKDLTPHFLNFGKRHATPYDKDPADMVVFRIIAGNPTYQAKLQREVLKLLNLEEKQREQSNRNRPKRRRRRH